MLLPGLSNLPGISDSMINMQNKRGFGGGVSAASPLIKSKKWVKKRKKGVSVVGVAYFPSGGVFVLYSNFFFISRNIIL